MKISDRVVMQKDDVQYRTKHEAKLQLANMIAEDMLLLNLIHFKAIRHGNTLALRGKVEVAETCENLNETYHEVDEFICSNCGLHLEDWNRFVTDEYGGERYYKEFKLRYCPKCGAIVKDKGAKMNE